MSIGKEYIDTYSEIRSRIESRLKEFRDAWLLGDSRHAYIELSFCIFTPQSSAKNSWRAVTELRENGLLFSGSSEEIIPFLRGVRFSQKKSKYLVEAREKFFDNFDLKKKIDEMEDRYIRREWLVDNVKGLGYKEASHYLRNIGLIGDLAILDRHILKHLVKLNVIDEIPNSLSKKKYFEIEKKMQIYSRDIGIPMDHLDFLLWYMEAKDVFR